MIEGKPVFEIYDISNLIKGWNKWTEVSYLDPDDLYGYGYLEAIKRVFSDDFV